MWVSNTKTVGKHVDKLLATNRSCLYSRQLFHQLFRVGELVCDLWTIGKHVGNCQPIKTRALFTWFICVTRHKMADAIQDRLEVTLKYIEEVHNCLAVWDVWSVVYKDTKNKQKKMGDLADKLGFVQTFLFLHRFLFLLFSSSVSLFYVSATALSRLSRLCCKLPCVVIWREFDVWRNEFANTSLPTYVCRVKATLNSHVITIFFIAKKACLMIVSGVKLRVRANFKCSNKTPPMNYELAVFAVLIYKLWTFIWILPVVTVNLK